VQLPFQLVRRVGSGVFEEPAVLLRGRQRDILDGSYREQIPSTTPQA
jgi:hypothetical protein